MTGEREELSRDDSRRLERLQGNYFFEAFRPLLGDAEAERILFIHYELHEGGDGSANIGSGLVERIARAGPQQRPAKKDGEPRRPRGRPKKDG